jgi:anaphase-promoting complex subunit 2
MFAQYVAEADDGWSGTWLRTDTWSTADLTTTLKLPDPSTTRNALYFWSNLSILRLLSPSEPGGEEGDIWRLIDDEKKDGAPVGEGEGEEVVKQHVVEEEQQAVQSVEEERLKEMRVFWQFVQGMVRPFIFPAFSFSFPLCPSLYLSFLPSLVFLLRRLIASLSKLTNLGALPLSRIHTTLNMLAPGYKGRTTDELTALLESVEREGAVMKTVKGDWKIVK